MQVAHQHDLRALQDLGGESVARPDLRIPLAAGVDLRVHLAPESFLGAVQGIHDYNFYIDGDLEAPGADPEQCHVRIVERRRGSPLDLLVAELMIVANSHWGGLLAEKGVPGLYRSQTAGKARMTTQPQPHEGLGVPQYAWCTSPLRRYADLVNQWQLIACLNGTPAPFAPRSELLFSALRDFEAAYAAYAEFQRGMERYWCLRWLRQDGRTSLCATTLRREGMVKIDHLPLALSIPSLPALPPGCRVELAIEGMDELALELNLRFVAELAPAAPDAAAEAEAEAAIETGEEGPA